MQAHPATSSLGAFSLCPFAPLQPASESAACELPAGPRRVWRSKSARLLSRWLPPRHPSLPPAASPSPSQHLGSIPAGSTPLIVCCWPPGFAPPPWPSLQCVGSPHPSPPCRLHPGLSSPCTYRRSRVPLRRDSRTSSGSRSLPALASLCPLGSPEIESSEWWLETWPPNPATHRRRVDLCPVQSGVHHGAPKATRQASPRATWNTTRLLPRRKESRQWMYLSVSGRCLPGWQWHQALLPMFLLCSNLQGLYLP
mmetsp:Transcript_41963/g.66500  ORF Transcript_41963/g.66500 Transcript_41963/m.66500 type:complete len:254 (-) Transcript_41963:71-832(-)